MRLGVVHAFFFKHFKNIFVLLLHILKKKAKNKSKSITHG